MIELRERLSSDRGIGHMQVVAHGFVPPWLAKDLYAWGLGCQVRLKGIRVNIRVDAGYLAVKGNFWNTPEKADEGYDAIIDLYIPAEAVTPGGWLHGSYGMAVHYTWLHELGHRRHYQDVPDADGLPTAGKEWIAEAWAHKWFKAQTGREFKVPPSWTLGLPLTRTP